MANYEPVIGLEVHCQLKTASKIFSSDPYKFGVEANSLVGPITMGLPGVLPVLNQEVLQMAVMAGLALDCKIAPVTKFDRKHYFYPDLPKGYQISQYDMPYATDGFIRFQKNPDEAPTRIGITRIHMEEDAGKLLHSQQSGVNKSYVDLNRAGVPLIEIVSEPDIRSSEEAYYYLLTLKNILQYVQVSDCNMEEGSLRCDANVSIRKSANDPFGTRVEIKNLNSFKAVRAAIDYEIERQTDILESGGKIVQCTALWDADKRETRVMRVKEDAEDYRYFPEPDLTVFHIHRNIVDGIQNKMPELPQAKKERFIKEYSLPEYDADVLTANRAIAEYFEKTAEISRDPKKSSNWVKDEVMGLLNKHDLEIDKFNITPERLGQMILLLNQGKITSKMAKKIFEQMFEENLDPQTIISKYQYQTVDSSLLPDIIQRVINANPDAIEKILSGNDRVKGFIVGQVMKETKGQASPGELNDLVDAAIEKLKSTEKSDT